MLLDFLGDLLLVCDTAHCCDWLRVETEQDLASKGLKSIHCLCSNLRPCVCRTMHAMPAAMTL
jgi:hypothetical protein